MNTNYKKLTAIVEVVQNNLTGYLNNYVIRQTQEKNKDFTLSENPTIHISVVGPFFENRNRRLEVDRVENVLRTITSIGNVLQPKNKDLSDADFITALHKIQDLLENGLLVNNSLTALHGMSHLTYKQSRQAGFGMFDSWIKKTWFQSRASVTYERTIDEFENLTRKILTDQSNTQSKARVN